jgi:tripartite-type tricarboxylate transporter receptor subunit TctC
MTHPGRKMKKPLLCLALGIAAIAPAAAQNYPSKPFRIVVPFAPGGGTDLLARLFSQRLQETYGQAATVDNRAGAGGNIGAEMVAKSAPDGYTLLLTSASITVNVSLYPKLGYALQRDLVPVSQMASSPLILTTHPSVPARSVKELVQISKKLKGGINFGSNGNGTTSHLSGLILAQMSGLQLTHIAFKGAGPAINGLLTGQADMGFIAAFSATPHIKSGRLRGLAASTKRPAPSLPELPTLDSMYAGFETDNWFGLFVPAGTPQPIVQQLHADLVKSLQHPAVKGFIDREGGYAIGSSSKEFEDFIRREILKYAQAVKASGAQPDQ